MCVVRWVGFGKTRRISGEAENLRNPVVQSAKGTPDWCGQLCCGSSACLMSWNDNCASLQDRMLATVRTGRSGRLGALMRVAICLALSTLVACAAMGKKPSRPDLKPWPEIRPDFRVETLRMHMHEYSITFAADVDLAAAAIERQAADSTVRRNAVLWRVRAIPEMRKACFRLAPVGALVDAWIFARQMNQLFCRRRGRARSVHSNPTPSRSRVDS